MFEQTFILSSYCTVTSDGHLIVKIQGKGACLARSNGSTRIWVQRHCKTHNFNKAASHNFIHPLHAPASHEAAAINATPEYATLSLKVISRKTRHSWPWWTGNQVKCWEPGVSGACYLPMLRRSAKQAYSTRAAPVAIAAPCAAIYPPWTHTARTEYRKYGKRRTPKQILKSKLCLISNSQATRHSHSMIYVRRFGGIQCTSCCLIDQRKFWCIFTYSIHPRM